MILNPILERRRQIDTLKIFNDNVLPVKEDLEYTVQFKAGETTFTMYVHLSPGFPLEKPTLRIQPPVIHEWVNTNNEIVGAPGYINFSVYSDLGRVVHAIIREFQKNPPPLQSSVNYKGVTATNTKISDKKLTPVPEDDVVAYITEKLKNMTLKELYGMERFDILVDDFVASLPVIQKRSKMISHLINVNLEIAESNLQYEPQLEQLQNEIKSKKEELSAAKQSYEKKYAQYEKLMEQYKPDNIKKLMKELDKKKEKECEDIAEKFISSQISLEQFLSQYLIQRKESHVLKQKLAKFSPH